MSILAVPWPSAHGHSTETPGPKTPPNPLPAHPTVHVRHGYIVPLRRRVTFPDGARPVDAGAPVSIGDRWRPVDKHRGISVFAEGA